MSEKKTVVATKPGYFGKLRSEGDEFEVPKDAKATWFVDKDAQVKPGRRPKQAEGDDAAGLT